MSRILSPQIDVVFKKMFADKNNIGLSRNLLSKILGIEENDLQDIVVLNPELLPEEVDQKFSRLDIRAKVAGKNVNIEMQVQNKDDYKSRALFYWAQLFTSDFKSGQLYSQIPETITINIVNFKLFKKKSFHSVFRVSDVETGEILVRASSQWVLLDTLKNRPLAITKRIEWFDLIEDRAVDTNFPKLPTVDVPQISISQIIRSDDIDLNNHVNNAVYPTWIFDALPSEFLSKHTLTKIQIQYKYPAKHGDDIQVLTNVSDENTTQHMIVGTEGKEYARIVCQWQ